MLTSIDFWRRFRNVTRIMNCVTCEKCILWGKLQITGVGTAIKLLLMSDEDLAALAAATPGSSTIAASPIGGSAANSKPSCPVTINRQEIIALVNTLHQLAKSIKFAANAERLESQERIKTATGGLMPVLWIVAGAVLVAVCFRPTKKGEEKSD